MTDKLEPVLILEIIDKVLEYFKLGPQHRRIINKLIWSYRDVLLEEAREDVQLDEAFKENQNLRDKENKVLWETLDKIRNRCIPIHSEVVDPHENLRQIRDLTLRSRIEKYL